MATETQKQDGGTFSLNSTNFAPWRIGLSMAASWSWGSSFASGIALLLTLGSPAWYLWAIPNCITLALFGFYWDKTERLRELVKLWPMVFFMVLLQMFVYFVNSQAIYEIASGGMDLNTTALLSNNMATVFTLAVGLGIAVFIHYYGLPGSITTDIIQYAVQVGGIAAVLIYAFGTGLDFGASAIPVSAGGAVVAAAGTYGIGLIFNPLYEAQLWQRIGKVDADKQTAAGLWASAWFSLYMVGVWLTAQFLYTQNPILTGLLLITVLGITTSTYDSAAASLQWLLDGRKRALVFSAAVILAWPLLKQFGIVAIFGVMASGRAYLGFVVIAVLIALWATNRHVDKNTVPNWLLIDRSTDVEDDPSIQNNKRRNKRKEATSDD